MIHTPTQPAPGVYRCMCGFHAVQTGAGLHVIDSGIGRGVHMEAIAQLQIEQAANRAIVEQQLRGLQQRCQERQPIFWQLYRLAWQEGREIAITDLPGERDDGSLTARQFRKYGQHIRTEHEG